MKPCKIVKTKNSKKLNTPVTLTARAGREGKGQVIARAHASDNGRAIDQALDAVLYECRRQGYEPIPYDASGDE